MRWDKADIPHKDWQYVGMEDLGEDVYPGDPIPYEQCEMCGKKKSDMSTYYSTLIMTEKYGSAVIVPRKCSVIM